MEIKVNRLKQQTEDPLDIFIKGWGRMGVCWGVGKMMAEIQALLYMSSTPLGLDEMSERLKTSRSNISLNVRALQDLGVVRKVIQPGDRRDYYTAETDLGKVARKLAAAKKKRELDPALDIVTRTLSAADAGDGAATNGIDAERLRELETLMKKIGGVFEMFIGDEMDDTAHNHNA
jgi:DNA-binding transcriptional regulator GbsR (MarR family)